MLGIEEVSKRYGDVTALGPTSLRLERGQTTVLIGPSGCGKSTLLRIIIGLVTPDSGSVKLQGVAMTPASAMELRRRMGYVIQDGGLFPHLTATANVTLMARHLRWTSERMAARVNALAELTRFPVEGLKRFPSELSGGQRQRVGLMRALMLDPDVLLLDEPLGALDPIVRNELQTDLRQVFRRLGKTVVMVTHDMGEAAYFGDRIALMRDGQIAQLGDLDDLLTRPADEFVTRFINAQRSPLDALPEAP